MILKIKRLKNLKNYCKNYSERNNYKPLYEKFYQKKIKKIKNKGDKNDR